MRNVVAVVLGGGQGSRLRPLTEFRSKPAVPLAGKYRLIDIPLSNCINSGLNRVYVLTQFLSVSLHRHIRRTYQFDNFSGGFIDTLAAQQTMTEGTDWFQGTADAVRKNMRYLTQPGIEHVLILSGDQLYRMDFAKMLQTHKDSGADVTIAAKPVHDHEAQGLGVMKVDGTGQVTGFVEKPQTPEEIDQVRMDSGWIEQQGIQSHGRDCLASMGIYLFNRDTLIQALEETDHTDFGKEVFPTAIGKRKVQLHPFDGYWEDIGTIRSFYEANLQLCHKDPPFDLTSALAPIYTRARFLPPTRVDGASISNSLIADGCVIEPGAKIENSVIGLRCRIGRDVVIRNSILMGADLYETPERLADNNANNLPPIGIGDGAVIDNAIIDKNCRIGRGAHLVNHKNIDEGEADKHCAIRDGILVAYKDASFEEGWRA
ncbi:glucose-1-phosphate adenylyltransferase [Adhaeretor mobilis]|uniref:Glucose-1-phosphate adenylyltransferase n=1 Tax=Adhaeretor mobilis TaxID=1930276 RepID=A0A517MSE2_9BACT|nr:glucose-1-phosphate adenylyltransferase [Adhaeretor mobilis]QDS97800.1 Glucose-1-phosphate adenylyltransferase [Adhaeretor mobilis]